MPTHFYHAIIWSSLLVVLGEGLILARFEIEPLGGGEVLGESTVAFFEEVENRRYPATYYIEDPLPEENATIKSDDQLSIGNDSANSPEAKQEVLQGENEEVFPAPATVTDEGNSEVNKVIEALNASSEDQSEQMVGGETDESRASVVDLLIRKNKRLYHKDIKKTLDHIGDTLD